MLQYVIKTFETQGYENVIINKLRIIIQMFLKPFSTLFSPLLLFLFQPHENAVL